MNSPGDIDATVSDDPEPDDGPVVVDEERIVAGAGLPGDADDDDDLPVPLDVGIEVPTADAIDQHRTVTLDDDHDQV
jgi:hypothetical protein